MLKNIISYYMGVIIWAKHVSSQNLRLPVLDNSMPEEKVVNVSAVDVDFAAYLREGEEALVAVVLPRLGGDARELAGSFGFYHYFWVPEMYLIIMKRQSLVPAGTSDC